jgi:hypothetical protein
VDQFYESVRSGVVHQFWGHYILAYWSLAIPSLQARNPQVI